MRDRRTVASRVRADGGDFFAVSDRWSDSGHAPVTFRIDGDHDRIAIAIDQRRTGGVNQFDRRTGFAGSGQFRSVWRVVDVGRERWRAVDTRSRTDSDRFGRGRTVAIRIGADHGDFFAVRDRRTDAGDFPFAFWSNHDDDWIAARIDQWLAVFVEQLNRRSGFAGSRKFTAVFGVVDVRCNGRNTVDRRCGILIADANGLSRSRAVTSRVGADGRDLFAIGDRRTDSGGFPFAFRSNGDHDWIAIAIDQRLAVFANQFDRATGFARAAQFAAVFGVVEVWSERRRAVDIRCTSHSDGLSRRRTVASRIGADDGDFIAVVDRGCDAGDFPFAVGTNGDRDRIAVTIDKLLAILVEQLDRAAGFAGSRKLTTVFGVVDVRRDWRNAVDRWSGVLIADADGLSRSRAVACCVGADRRDFFAVGDCRSDSGDFPFAFWSHGDDDRIAVSVNQRLAFFVQQFDGRTGFAGPRKFAAVWRVVDVRRERWDAIDVRSRSNAHGFGGC